MNANSISRPINQQTANSWTPLLAAVLLSIALVAGVAGIAALTARSVSTTSPVFVPKSVNVGEQSGQKTLQGVPYPGGVAGPSQLDATKTLPGVPFPGGVAGPSQLDATKTLPGVPFPGGVAGPSQLDVLKTTPVAPAYDWINGIPHPITAPVFVPQSVNIDDQHAKPFVPQTVNSRDYPALKPLRGVPFPGGVAGPSQLDRFHAPGMGGH
jgi:hypothetical protein